MLHSVAYSLKVSNVEPEKQPLLANGSEQHSFLGNGRETDNGTTSVAREQILNKQEQTAASTERIGKRVPAATDTRMNGGVCAGRAEQL
jgi:hypothetical protein